MINETIASSTALAVSDLFRVLAHPARLAVLEELRAGEQCVCHLEAVLGFRQAYLSQQLGVLRAAGLVEDRRDGWNIFYRVSSPQVYDVLQAATALGAKSQTTNREVVEKLCPCPKCKKHDSDSQT
jgi:ArsR family transcriptional regulator